MKKAENQFDFKAKETIEQRHFETAGAASFFREWCKINDSIQPEFIDRKEWEERGSAHILEKQSDGKQELYLPTDLKLWEMVGIMETIDHDTFAENPERRDAKKQELMQLGKHLHDAGLYIAKRIGAINEGRNIAKALAEEFYAYGESLRTGKKPEEETSVDTMADMSLSSDETEAVDQWLAGENLYASRHARAEKMTAHEKKSEDESLESQRLKTLAQFFRAADTALELRSLSDKGELETPAELTPWEDPSVAPIHAAFLKKMERQVTKTIETPKREFQSAIFRRGMELLRQNIGFDTLPGYLKHMIIHWENGEKTLRQALQIDRMKAELDDLRQKGDLTKISYKERWIAFTIQQAVSNFEYKENANNPSEMAATQEINCVGASTLGGALLYELGISYLVGDVPKHSLLILITSDQRIFWRDMLAPASNGEITDDIIYGKTKNNQPLTVADVVHFSKHPSSEGLMFDIGGDEYRTKLSWVKDNQRQYITVFPPEIGQQTQVLNNTGNMLLDIHRYNESIQAYRQAIAGDPKFIYPYHGLGSAFLALGRKEEAIKAYQQGIAINPQYINLYNCLADIFIDNGQYKEAADTSREAIAIDPNDPDAYYGLADSLRELEEKDAALKAYSKFIDLAEKDEDQSSDWSYWISEARQNIYELRKELSNADRPAQSENK